MLDGIWDNAFAVANVLFRSISGSVRGLLYVSMRHTFRILPHDDRIFNLAGREISFSSQGRSGAPYSPRVMAGVESLGKIREVMHIAPGKKQSGKKLAQYEATSSSLPVPGIDSGSALSSPTDAFSACKAMPTETAWMVHVERWRNNEHTPAEKAELLSRR